jgi:hypothetical protein
VLTAALVTSPAAQATVIIQLSSAVNTDLSNAGYTASEFPVQLSFSASGSTLTLQVDNETNQAGAIHSLIDKLFFNTDTGVTLTLGYAPSGWSMTPDGIASTGQSKSADGFGKFSWELDASGNNTRLNVGISTFTFSFSGETASQLEAGIANTGTVSNGNPPAYGTNYAAMHIVPLSNSPTGGFNTGYAGGNSVRVVSAPPSLVLGFVGISGVGVIGAWRRWRRAA